MGALLFGWLVTGVIFLSHGAWPVFGFFGLDVLLVYVAFGLNYRAARAREEVSVSRTSLDIQKIAPSGRSEAHRFNPFWARFAVARHERSASPAWRSKAQGRAVPIGGFLNPDDRESFARAFRARWRRRRRDRAGKIADLRLQESAGDGALRGTKFGSRRISDERPRRDIRTSTGDFA